jgi:hypothetical protein
MLTEVEYKALKLQSEKASAENDYSKMIMIGSPEYIQMQEYKQSVCKHDGPGYVGRDMGHYCGLCNKKL